jgi:uncharacterized protein (TIGR02996 family)
MSEPTPGALTYNGRPVPIGGPSMPLLEAKLKLAPPSVDRAQLRQWEERLCGHICEVPAGDGMSGGLLCGPPPDDHADALRVYADWLDESGWPEFAETVRESMGMEFGGMFIVGWLMGAEREQAVIDAICKTP